MDECTFFLTSHGSRPVPICWNVPWGWITFGKRILTQFFVKCQSQNLGPLQPQSLLGSCWEGFGIAAWSTVKIKNISGMIVTCISSWKGLRHGSISLFWLWECFSSIRTIVFCWRVFWEGQFDKSSEKKSHRKVLKNQSTQHLFKKHPKALRYCFL